MLVFVGSHRKWLHHQVSQKDCKLFLRIVVFNTKGLWAKCSPVCPFESQNCCLVQLLLQQDDFVNQPSMLETLIKGSVHECLFLLKFHCELNPIEMVRFHPVNHLNSTSYHLSYLVLGMVQVLVQRAYKS